MPLIHQELKRKGVTLQLLWEEYEKAHGQSAYRYSQFCLHYHEYRGRLARSMRQVHRAGEKVFIDYSGDTVAVIDAKSGEILTAEIFVATLGASKYAYAEATWTQTPAGLDRLDDPDAGVLRGGAEPVDPGQSESGDPQGLSLRAGGDLDLPGLREPLWRGDPAGASLSREG